MMSLNKEQKLKKINSLVKKYKKVLYLDDWEFNIKMADDNDGAAAWIKPDPVYKHANLTVDHCAFKPPNNIENIIKHELCHCLTETLYRYCIDFLNGRFRGPNDIEDQRELLTDKISKLI